MATRQAMAIVFATAMMSGGLQSATLQRVHHYKIRDSGVKYVQGIDRITFDPQDLSSNEIDQIMVKAAESWMLAHGIDPHDSATWSAGVEVTYDEQLGPVATVHIPGGGSVVIILSSGPFLPKESTSYVINGTASLPISNGF